MAELFISGGSLYDTSQDAWHKLTPLRENYEKHHRDIKTVADFKATLRAGEFCFPGGYQLEFYTSDGDTMSFTEARESLTSVYWSIQNQVDDGWRIIACDINYYEED